MSMHWNNVDAWEDGDARSCHHEPMNGFQPLDAACKLSQLCLQASALCTELSDRGLVVQSLLELLVNCGEVPYFI
eukprot:4211403-Amphidinium_carterae.1